MGSIETSEPVRPVSVVAVFAVLAVTYWIGTLIYRVYFHPLHKVPGPKLNAISRIPYTYHLNKGDVQDNVQYLHDKYGGIVRVGPSEISFSSGQSAWPDIYGFRTGKWSGHSTFPKDPIWFPTPLNGAPSLIVADDANHSRMRKVWSHAFSERALAQQEVLLQGYVDQLIDRLKETAAATGKPVDMVKWYNWTTFDVIADLLYGESFGCLQDMATHKHVETLFRSVMGTTNNYVSRYFPAFKRFLIRPGSVSARVEFFHWVVEKVRARLDGGTERPDLISKVLEHNGKKAGEELTFDEIVSNCSLITIAGSETTATLLSGVTYFLFQNPTVMQKLKDEIRGSYKSYGDITLESVQKLPYMLAVLQEALRLYPPVPTGFPRVVPPGGEIVNGYYLPEKTSVYVSSWSVGRSEENFKDARSFIPERWMGAEEYANDRRSASQPFSFGPRACLGKNLAYAEMRLILAKIMWTFDMELDPKCHDWLERNKVFTLFEKPELTTTLTEVVRD